MKLRYTSYMLFVSFMIMILVLIIFCLTFNLELKPDVPEKIARALIIIYRISLCIGFAVSFGTFVYILVSIPIHTPRDEEIDDGSLSRREDRE